MRVLGVDPGIATTGVAVVDGRPGRLHLVHCGHVGTDGVGDDPRRLAALLVAIEAVVASHRPDVAAVEQLFFANNRRSAFRVAQARGVVLCALARCGVPVAEYTPLQVKETVTGFGGAGKPQVARMVEALLRTTLPPGPDDVADACAVAVCHHHRHRLSDCRRDVPPGVATSSSAGSTR